MSTNCYTPTCTPFTNCVMAALTRARRKKEGTCCLHIANGKLLIPADGEMLRPQGDDF